MKKLLNILGWGAGLLVALLVLVGGITQTQFFRDRVRQAAIDRLDSLLTAQVTMGEITGNLVTGFALDTLAISLDGVPIVEVGRVELGYDLFSLPRKTLSVNRIVLEHPTIRILKDRQSRWNVSRMIRSAPPDSAAADTTGGIPDWGLTLASLQIRGGTVTLIDSIHLAETPRDSAHIDFSNLLLRNVALLLSARSTKEAQILEIGAMSADVDRPAFHLKRLAFTARVSQSEARVEGLSLASDRSDIRLSASLGRVDLLGGFALEDLRESPMRLSARINTLDLAEFRMFLPAVDFLDGIISLELEAGGSFGAMEIGRLNLLHDSTAIFMRGTLSNLHRPEDLELDVTASESRIDPGDLLTLLPGLDLPDFRAIGPALVTLRFTGRPLDFTSSMDVRTAVGRVTADRVWLAIGGPSTLAYDAKLTFMDLNAAPLVGDSLLSTRLNGTLSVKGSGVSLRSLHSELSLGIDSSSVRDLPLAMSRLHVQAADARLRSTLLFSLGEMFGDLSGELASAQGSVPAYSVAGEVRAINLEEFLHAPEYNSDLTLRLDARGRGLDWENLVGEAVLDFSSSRFSQYTIDSGSVRLSVDRLDSMRQQLTFESNVLDVVLTGVFHLPHLVQVVRYHADNLQWELGQKLAGIDPSLASTVDPARLRRRAAELSAAARPFDMQFGMLMKNLEPVSILTGLQTFNGIGTLTGSVWGDVRSLGFQTDLDLEEFFYGTEEAGVLIENGSFVCEATSITPLEILARSEANAGIKVGSLHINRLELDTLEGEFDYALSRGFFWGNVSVDRSLQVAFGGSGEILGESAAIALSRFGIRHREYQWWADQGTTIEIDRGGARLRNLTMLRNGERVSAEASLGSGGEWQMALRGSDLDLASLRYLLEEEETPQRGAPLFAGRATVSMDAGGTLLAPWYVATVGAVDVSYRGAVIGRVSANLQYADSSLSVHFESRSGQGLGDRPPELTIEGTIPVHLALAGVGESRRTDQPLDLTLRANGFQLAVFDPFLVAFNDFTGLLTCDVHVGGTLLEPSYDGTLSVADGGFLFEPNNIYYLLDGSFRAEGDRIRVVEAKLRNIPEDNRGGATGLMTVAGDLRLPRFRPGDFRLTMTGSLLVVREDTRSSSLEVSGNLFVEIGRRGLSLTGEFHRSLLKGELMIRNSSLVFPPTEGNVAEESALSVPVVQVDDTVRVVERKRRSAAERYFVSRLAGGAAGPGAARDSSISFVDGMRYELEIESVGGTTEIEMVFNSLTSEKLVATIDGKFTILGDKSRWFGELAVNRAYYNFLKRFEADGKIRFTGDYMNPTLDIKARYRDTRLIQDSTGTQTEQVVVVFAITGTREEPKIAYGMTIDDIDYISYRGPKSNDVQSDALQFIVYGTFPLTAAQRNETRSDLERTLGSTVVTGATSLLTGALSEYLRAQTGFINSVEFNYSGGAGRTLGESAEIRLSGSLWNGYWRYGGKILDDPFGNANVSLMYSFGSILGEPSLRNLMFELERKVESLNAQTYELKRVNSARVFYRLSF